MPKLKSRPYYQYMLDLIDHKASYYSSDDIGLIVFDLLDDGEDEEALSVCLKGLDLHPADDYIEAVQAKVLARLHRIDESQKLITGNPNEQTPFGYSILFAIDLQRGSSQQALQQVLEHLLQARVTVQEFVDIIDEYFDYVQHDVCAQILLQAVHHLQHHRTPGNEDLVAEALGRMGAMLMDCGCHRDAIPVLEFALDIDAYDVYSWQDLARCQYELQMYDDCRQSCEMGIAIDPTNPLFNFALGYIACQHEQYAQAIPLLEVARSYTEGSLQHESIHLDRHEMEQQSAITYELLGVAYVAVGRIPDAISCYQALVHHNPSFAEGHFRLAHLYAAVGDRQSALYHVNQALTLAPGNAELLALRQELGE